MSKSVIGDSPRRREDARFITGRGAYVDDLPFERLTRAVFVRSPHAHARIHSIDTTAARKAAGVLAVLSAADVKADGLKSLRPYAEANVQTGERFRFDEQPLLAADKVRFMGETVAIVVAETLAQALDASELVEVDYEALPAVTTAKAAVAAHAPLLSSEVPGNVCMDWRTGDAQAAEAAFAKAAHVVTLALDNHRVTTNPIEPRGSVGTFDQASGRYTLHISSQNIHINRNHAARCLGVEPGQCRRLSRRRRRRRADLPVRTPAGHGLSPAGDCAPCPGGAEQHHADRRDARAGVCRDGQHPRAPDRRGGARVRLRPREPAPAQHGAGARDADDQRLRLRGRQRRLS